ERADAERERSDGRLAALRTKLERIEADAAAAERTVAEAEAVGEQLAAAAETARDRRDEAERALAEAEAARDETAAEHNTWAARVEALTLALDEARARAGAERLADVEGVMGTLLELVDIDPGWEAAAEAACGEALAAVVVDSVDSGRRALDVLAAGDVAGAVLALGVSMPRRSAPPVGEPVLRHVRPRRPEVGPLLEGLLGAAVAVDGGWATALDVALAHPDAVVVTLAGGRFGAGGWRVSTATTGATGAALDEAREQATAAAAAADTALDAHREAKAALSQARNDEAAATKALERHRTARAAAA